MQILYEAVGIKKSWIAGKSTEFQLKNSNWHSRECTAEICSFEVVNEWLHCECISLFQNRQPKRLWIEFSSWCNSYCECELWKSPPRPRNCWCRKKSIMDVKRCWKRVLNDLSLFFWRSVSTWPSKLHNHWFFFHPPSAAACLFISNSEENWRQSLASQPTAINYSVCHLKPPGWNGPKRGSEATKDELKINGGKLSLKLVKEGKKTFIGVFSYHFFFFIFHFLKI